MTAIGIKRKLDNEGYTVTEYETNIPKRKIGDVTDNAGVYALFYGSKVQFIGQTNDLHREISKHINQGNIPFGSFCWYNIHHTQLNNAMNALLEYYDPPYNPI